MVQQLKALAAPAKDSGSQKRIVGLTNTYDSSPGGSEALFWLLKAQVQVWRPHTHTHTWAHTHILKNKGEYSPSWKGTNTN